MPCILLAESEQAPPVVPRALEGCAVDKVVVPVRAIIAGLRCDDSLMHKLLETVKANPATRELEP